MDFIDEHGLINSRPDEKNAENSFLWSVQNYYLNKLNGTLSEAHISVLKASLDKMRVRYGIYHQNPSFADSKPKIEHDRFMSRDQIFAIFAISKEMGWDYHIEIWNEIKRQSKWGFIPRYDNINPDKPNRYITPQDYIFLGHCVGDKFCKSLVLVTGVTCLVSCSSEHRETSGKLLAFLRCMALIDNKIIGYFWNRCCKKIEKTYAYGWYEVFLIYFKHKDHPNVKLAKELYYNI